MHKIHAKDWFHFIQVVWAGYIVGAWEIEEPKGLRLGLRPNFLAIYWLAGLRQSNREVEDDEQQEELQEWKEGKNISYKKEE